MFYYQAPRPEVYWDDNTPQMRKHRAKMLSLLNQTRNVYFNMDFELLQNFIRVYYDFFFLISFLVIKIKWVLIIELNCN